MYASLPCMSPNMLIVRFVWFPLVRALTLKDWSPKREGMSLNRLSRKDKRAVSGIRYGSILFNHSCICSTGVRFRSDTVDYYYSNSTYNKTSDIVKGSARPYWMSIPSMAKCCTTFEGPLVTMATANLTFRTDHTLRKKRWIREW